MTVLARPIEARVIPSSVLPGLGPAAARRAVDVDRPPWRSVVRVQTEIGSRCTGVLIGPRLVLTAAHCLFGRGTGRVVRPASVHVLTDYSHGSFAGHARTVSVEIGAGFQLAPDGGRSLVAAADSDWARLTLDAPLGMGGRSLPLMGQLPVAGAEAMLGGYEQDRAEIVVADVACRVVGIVRVGSAPMIQHSCAGTHGVSGAPLLVKAPDGSWVVAGIASLAEIGVSGGLAVPAATIALPRSALP